MARSKSNRKDWSMYPGLHEQVLKQLRQSGLAPQYHRDDDAISCTKYYDTNIMGKFRCFNSKCSNKGWSSKKIAITIRLYNDDEYNAIVYHQLCKQCEKPSVPSLDGSYADRISYRLKKWSGLDVYGAVSPYKKTERPHETDLCLGCKNGHCEKGRTAELDEVNQLAGLRRR